MIMIIPAIDIIEGKCVRLQKGDYEKKTVYDESPLEMAKMFEDHGIRRLHLVDLDGAKAKKVINYRILEDIAHKTSLVVDFGGGIKSDEDIRKVFNAGAAMVTIGSVAVNKPELFYGWLDLYGGEKIILGADILNNQIAISGWVDVTNISINDLLSNYLQRGVRNVLCTDISKDGMLEGTAMDLYRTLKKDFPSLHFIASGGIKDIQEIYELNKIGVSGVIIGKAIYEGRIQVKELTRFL